MKPFINGSCIKKLFSKTKARIDEKLDSWIEKALKSLPEEKLPWEKMAQIATVLSLAFVFGTLVSNLLLYLTEQRYLGYFNIPPVSFNITLNRASLSLLFCLFIAFFAPWCIHVLSKPPSYINKKNLKPFFKINLLYISWIPVATLVSLCWEHLVLLVYLFQFLSSFVTTCLTPKSIYSTDNPARCNFLKLWLHFVCLTFLPLLFSLVFCLEVFGVDCFEVRDSFFSKLIVREIFLCFQVTLLGIAILYYRLRNSTSKWLRLSVTSLIFFAFAYYVLTKSDLLSDTVFVLSRFDQYALSYQRHVQSTSGRVYTENQYQLILDFKTPNSSYDTLVKQKPVIIPFYDEQAYYVFPCNSKEKAMQCLFDKKDKTPIRVPKDDVLRIRPYLDD